jgi:hypothetical protein
MLYLVSRTLSYIQPPFDPMLLGMTVGLAKQARGGAMPMLLPLLPHPSLMPRNATSHPVEIYPKPPCVMPPGVPPPPPGVVLAPNTGVIVPQVAGSMPPMAAYHCVAGAASVPPPPDALRLQMSYLNALYNHNPVTTATATSSAPANANNNNTSTTDNTTTTSSASMITTTNPTSSAHGTATIAPSNNHVAPVGTISCLSTSSPLPLPPSLQVNNTAAASATPVSHSVSPTPATSAVGVSRPLPTTTIAPKMSAIALPIAPCPTANKGIGPLVMPGLYKMVPPVQSVMSSSSKATAVAPPAPQAPSTGVAVNVPATASSSSTGATKAAVAAQPWMVQAPDNATLAGTSLHYYPGMSTLFHAQQGQAYAYNSSGMNGTANSSSTNATSGIASNAQMMPAGSYPLYNSSHTGNGNVGTGAAAAAAAATDTSSVVIAAKAQPPSEPHATMHASETSYTRSRAESNIDLLEHLPDFLSGFDQVALNLSSEHGITYDTASKDAPHGTHTMMDHNCPYSPTYTSRSFDDLHQFLGKDLSPTKGSAHGSSHHHANGDGNYGHLQIMPTSITTKSILKSPCTPLQPHHSDSEALDLFSAESYALFAQESALLASQQHSVYLPPFGPVDASASLPSSSCLPSLQSPGMTRTPSFCVSTAMQVVEHDLNSRTADGVVSAASAQEHGVATASTNECFDSSTQSTIGQSPSLMQQQPQQDHAQAQAMALHQYGTSMDANARMIGWAPLERLYGQQDPKVVSVSEPSSTEAEDSDPAFALESTRNSSASEGSKGFYESGEDSSDEDLGLHSDDDGDDDDSFSAYSERLSKRVKLS